MIPVMVWRVYPDGRPDELVRGVDIVGTPLASLNNIMLTGDTLQVFNGVCGAESGQVPVSAAPAPGHAVFGDRSTEAREGKRKTSAALATAGIRAVRPLRIRVWRKRNHEANRKIPMGKISCCAWPLQASVLLLPGLLAASRPAHSGRAPMPKSSSSDAAAASDPRCLLRAMREELDRSKSQLKMESVPSPYYIEYRLSDVDEYQADAVFGALRRSQRNHERSVRVVVRVGDYKQDSYLWTREPAW